MAPPSVAATKQKVSLIMEYHKLVEDSLSLGSVELGTCSIRNHIDKLLVS